MDTELVAFLKEHFDAINERFDRMEERLDRLETEVRHLHVRFEDQQSQIRLVAEGVAGNRETQVEFRTEMRQELREVQRLMKVSFNDYGQRLRQLEAAA